MAARPQTLMLSIVDILPTGQSVPIKKNSETVYKNQVFFTTKKNRYASSSLN